MLLLVLTVTVVWFAKNAGRELVHPDEGRYAEIPREMWVSGDWVTPRLNDLKYFEKPPLQYWATAVAYDWFGPSEWSSRLWLSLTGLVCVAATWYAGGRLFGRIAGRYAALALLSSPYFVLSSAINTLDMGVSCFLTLAVYAYLLAHISATRFAARAWMVGAWAAMALAVLSKGLIGVVLPAATVALYCLWQRSTVALRGMVWVPGLVIFLVLVVPWFYLMAQANPGFLELFFVHEHWQRFSSTEHRRAGPFWYYAPILLTAVAPWAIAAARGLSETVRESARTVGVAPVRLLLCWCIVVLVFFSFAQSKLPGYVLPMIPALALLAGAGLARDETHRSAFWVATSAMVFGVLAFGLIELAEGKWMRDLQERYETFGLWEEGASMLFVVAGGVGLYWVERASPRRLIGTLLVVLFVAISVGIRGMSGLASSHSAAAIAQEISKAGLPRVPVFSVKQYDQTLPFYLGRPVILAAYEGELARGIAAEPHKHVSSLEAFVDRWSAEPQAFAVLSAQAYASLRAAGVPMTTMLIERERVLVRKP